MSVAEVSQSVASLLGATVVADVSQGVAQCFRSMAATAVAGCHGCIATQRLRQLHTLKGVCAVVAGEVVDGVGKLDEWRQGR